MSRPVGRVLCARLRGAAVIHLGLPLPTASCGLPASIGRAALNRSRREPLVPLLTLLRVGFTEPPQSPAALVVSYTAFSPLPPRKRGGGLFSVALSRGSPRVAVSNHRALWSPDFPRRTRGNALVESVIASLPRPSGRLVRRSKHGSLREGFGVD